MKKILFVIDSLSIGGNEKSLVTLLNTLDYSKYDVDLQIFNMNGCFLKLLPDEVDLLELPIYYKFVNGGIVKGLFNKKYPLVLKINMLKTRLSYSLEIRRRTHTHYELAVEFWKRAKKCFIKCAEHYDVAIAYSQNIPTFYVSDCIDAEKKITWVNSEYYPQNEYYSFVQEKYSNFDYIVSVSDKQTENMKKEFSEYADKCHTIYDINNADLIKKMADMENVLADYNGIKIVTAGRYNQCKGYDMAIDACKILIDKGYDVHWFAVGEGPERINLEKQIKDRKLEDRFILLGAQSNPYKYMKAADVYVQTSRSEGFCLTLAEARILNKPCVTTNFECVYNQMIQEKNGLVVDMNAHAIAAGIERMINDDELRNSIVEYLKTEKKGNPEEIEKVYSLFGDSNL